MARTDPAESTRLTPDEACAALGNPRRAAILRALWTATDEPVSFSELRHLAGNPDSGQFNYHLGELVGRFVTRTDEGYQPVQTGMEVLRTVLLGSGDDLPALEGISIDDPCHHCGGDLEASYDGRDALVQCSACDKTLFEESIPASAFECRVPEEMVRACDRWVRGRSLLMTEGVCPDCAGRPETTLVQTRPAEDGNWNHLRARTVCRNCAYECDVPLWLYVLLARPAAVVAFYHERGVDLKCAPVWELTGYGSNAVVTLEAEDPLRIGVALEYDHDVLSLRLDEELEIVEARSVRDATLLSED
jgi:hypothetical protein